MPSWYQIVFYAGWKARTLEVMLGKQFFGWNTIGAAR